MEGGEWGWGAPRVAGGRRVASGGKGDGTVPSPPPQWQLSQENKRQAGKGGGMRGEGHSSSAGDVCLLLTHTRTPHFSFRADTVWVETVPIDFHDCMGDRRGNGGGRGGGWGCRRGKSCRRGFPNPLLPLTLTPPPLEADGL